MRFYHLNEIRYLRAVGLWAAVIGASAISVYLISNGRALSSQSHFAIYRDVTWEDLLEHRPSPPEPTKPGEMPASLGPDPWANRADDMYGDIRKGMAKPGSSVVHRRQELDGADVRLFGYVVPLQDSPDHAITEFFLVPYFGACIHVPQPPPDQIVYINFPQGVRIDNIYRPFQVRGTLHIQELHTGFADTTYMMVADAVTYYDPQVTR